MRNDNCGHGRKRRYSNNGSAIGKQLLLWAPLKTARFDEGIAVYGADEAK